VSQASDFKVHVQDPVDSGATLCDGGAVIGCVLQCLTNSSLGELHAGLTELLPEFLDKAGGDGGHDCAPETSSCDERLWGQPGLFAMRENPVRRRGR
jgi:hypothetical protein